jgi:dTDP-4-amino-4,6-dideoxygalactose transaminase
MDAIMKIAKKHSLIVIEDAAHATGAEYNGKKVGSYGDMTNFSFHPVKNMSTGDGGMVTTNNEKYAERLSQLRLHGMSKDAWKRHSIAGSWKYDIEEPGYKYNMMDTQAALGIQQLKKVKGFIKTREDYAKKYDIAFSVVPEITIPFNIRKNEHIYSLYTIKIDSSSLTIGRDEIYEELKKAQIGPSVYFIPVHHFSYYKKKYGYNIGDFPVADKVFEQILSLPLHPGMKPSDISYVAKTLIKIITSHRK